jgi:hypothetical protein
MAWEIRQAPTETMAQARQADRHLMVQDQPPDPVGTMRHAGQAAAGPGEASSSQSPAASAHVDRAIGLDRGLIIADHPREALPAGIAV